MPKIRDLIYRGHDPYADFDAEAYQSELTGWFYDHPIFGNIFEVLRPAVVIEVGTYYGASAIHMANIARRLGLETEIVCVDTFLGSLEHWGVGDNSANSLAALRLRNELPRIYDYFLANVVKSDVSQFITPCPMTSAMATTLLRQSGVMADAVYLDAGHDYSSVANDIANYWPLVRRGGVLFGDDYDLRWAGVIRAVQEWSERERVQISYLTAESSTPTGKGTNTKWYVQKSGG